MTTEEFEKIALWMGWHKEETPLHGEWWMDDHGRWRKPVDSTSLTPAECYEALNRLVEKGYFYEQWGDKLNRGLDIGRSEWREDDYAFHEDPNCIHTTGDTIAAAVEQALLQIAAKEG